MLIPNAPAVNELSEGLGTVPEATYTLKVHKSEYIATPRSANAKGPYIKTQLVITGYVPQATVQGQVPVDPAQFEQYVGRYVFMNYSLTGDGSFRLRELLTVTGHPEDFRLTDSDQLLGLEFKGVVTIQAGTGGYSDKNQVTKHLALL